jgi:hypothetical protein
VGSEQASYENPVILTLENEELYRAFEDMINQLQRRDDQAARAITLPINVDFDVTTDFVVIPRVGQDGWGLGRVSMAFTHDLTQSSTNYWTFSLYYYYTDTGTRTVYPVIGGSWTTAEHGLRAYVPKVLELDRPLDPEMTLRLKVVRTGTADYLRGSMLTEEMYGPEE